MVFFASEDHLRYIELLLNSLASMFKKWGEVISEHKNDTGFSLDDEVDSDLLTEISTFCQNAKINDVSESSDMDSDDKAEMTIDFLNENLAIIQKLKDQLSESAESTESTDVVPDIQQTLSMLKGNCEVLTASTSTAFQKNHPVYSITNLLDEMLAVLNYQVQHQRGLSTQIIEQFTFCIDDLENLFNSFNDSEKVIESSTYEELKNLSQRIKDAESDQKKNEDDRTLPAQTADIPAGETKAESTFLSIKLERVEDLGNLIGELVVAKNAFNNIKTLVSKGDKQRTSEFLKKTQDSFQRIISDLDSIVMKMRMQKVKTLFNRFPRVARDLSKQTGKEIDLTFSGEETEIDNRILSAVTDPFMHLVRNSLDHGIEDPATRERNGKKAMGTITLSAMNRNGRTILEIYDDGKGIDPDVLKNKAIEKGLISTDEAQNLTEKEARNIIFMPGFSTSGAVTQISGRGVGMDVVMESIKSINGEIDIESQAGRYTKMALSLPLTISVSKGLKIKFEDELFLIPMDDIIKMTYVERQAIHFSKDHVFTTVDDKIQLKQQNKTPRETRSVQKTKIDPHISSEITRQLSLLEHQLNQCKIKRDFAPYLFDIFDNVLSLSSFFEQTGVIPQMLMRLSYLEKYLTVLNTSDISYSHNAWELMNLITSDIRKAMYPVLVNNLEIGVCYFNPFDTIDDLSRSVDRLNEKGSKAVMINLNRTAPPLIDEIQSLIQLKKNSKVPVAYIQRFFGHKQYWRDIELLMKDTIKIETSFWKALESIVQL